MKLITTNNILRGNLSRLVKGYPNLAFAVAWASANTSIFEQIINNKSQIQKAVIGTHFWQTHPNVLDVFVDSQNVRFMLQPKGVFHPKVFLFWDSNRWEALIGSANLTEAALTYNSEVMLLVSDSDESASTLKDQIIALVAEYWSSAVTVSKDKALSYREIWQTKQSALRRISGQYGKSKTRKAPMDSVTSSMSWPKFLAAVKEDKSHGFQQRCELLELVRSEFTRNTNFSSMERGLRKTIGGLPNKFDERWAWFGSMKGAGYFHQAVNENNPHLSQALDKIPLHGLVSRSQYDEFLQEFIKAFPKGRDGIGNASRLLALKRPDQFVCFDSKNQKELCKDFGIKQTGMDYERYWDEIIEPIMDSPWWDSPRPSSKVESMVWDGRAAMLDSIFYRP